MMYRVAFSVKFKFVKPPFIPQSMTFAMDLEHEGPVTPDTSFKWRNDALAKFMSQTSNQNLTDVDVNCLSWSKYE